MFDNVYYTGFSKKVKPYFIKKRLWYGQADACFFGGIGYTYNMVDEKEIEMKTASQINTAILSGSFTAEEIRSISQAISIKFKEMQRVATFRYAKGDKVTFQTRSGETITGVVTRVNQKTVSVKTPSSQWKVSGSLLQRA